MLLYLLCFCLTNNKYGNIEDMIPSGVVSFKEKRMKNLRNLNKKRIDIEEIQQYLDIENYIELVNAITNLINKEIILPIKSSKSNGKNPALYNRYSILNEKQDNFYDTTEPLSYYSYSKNHHKKF